MVRASFSSERETGFHEAGHAVIGHARGLTVIFVELDCGLSVGRFGGTTRFKGGERFKPSDFVVALLAAGEAERYGFGMVRDGCDAIDLQMARDQVAAVLHISATDAMVEEVLEAYRSEARDEVVKHWAWIDAVATALRCHRILDAAAIERLRPELREQVRTTSKVRTLGGVENTGTMPAPTETDHERIVT